MATRILMVEDDLTFSTMLTTWLRKKGFDVSNASSVGAAVKGLIRGEEPPQLILSDLRLPDHDGLYLLQWMQRESMSIPFIVMTHYADVQNAVEAMKLGAADYISKPVQPDLLLQKIHDALQAAQEKATLAVTHPSPTSTSIKAKPNVNPKAESMKGIGEKNANGKENKCAKTTEGQSGIGTQSGIEGHSPVACELYRLVKLVAPTPMSVLIIGASGTGKEYVAHRIHEQSARHEGPFVAIDCGALTKELAASELFGHVKGAFTGAVSDKIGAFEQATGGTLFLDEVGNLSYDVQVQLLRALQERRVRPVGSNEERVIDIRLVCATNENLPNAIQRGAFREDLYHRINEFTLHMPLLRDRGEDILEFAHYFLQQANKELQRDIIDFSPDAQSALLRYAWPGNLREMRNAVVRAALLAEGMNYISASQLNLPAPNVNSISPKDTFSFSTKETSTFISKDTSTYSLKPSADEELQHIREALQRTGGNKSRAAQLLGIDRKTLYNKLKQYGE